MRPMLEMRRKGAVHNWQISLSPEAFVEATTTRSASHAGI